MEKEKFLILQYWLEIEFARTANKTGYIPDKNAEVTYELLLQTIRYLDKETTKPDKIDKNYVICIVALMWEHTNREIYDLRIIILRFLARIGYPTSAIVTDSDFDYQLGKFSAINSVLDEIVTSAQISRYEIAIENKTYLLTDFQMNIWNSMMSEKNICISAPTSAGKSFVILLSLIKRLLMKAFDIVYIVPTISLVNQVTEDFRKMINIFNISNCNISSSYNPEYINDINIYVLTQEKAIAAFCEYEVAFERNTAVVVDEIQNIERIVDEADIRSKILFDVLSEFRDKENVIQTVISGPRIDELGKVGQQLWRKHVCEHTTTESPVVNITYSIQKNGSKYYLKQYCNISKKIISCEVTNLRLIAGYGGKIYSEEFLKALNELLKNIGEEKKNIVFAPTAQTARKIALAIDGTRCQEQELIAYYCETVHPRYSLCETISHGVAYHHGKLPLHVRRTLETAISEGKINTVVCTTTLMQGVNLPAQNIIIRNPHLYVRKRLGSTELTDYEMANLRGRAGRLMKEFIGRTFVLDESGFIETDGYEQQSLFEDSYKKLPSGYEERFEKYKVNIENALNSDNPIDADMYEYGYLVTYIRQAVLRHGKAAVLKMKKVGIKLSSRQVAAIIAKLDGLTVPREICLKNRYWDPYVLNYMFQHYRGQPPLTVQEKGAKSKVAEMMKFLRDDPVTSSVYKKYIPNKYWSGQQRSRLISLCFKYANNTTLRDILSEAYYDEDDGADRIEDTIAILQNTISYDLPTLLKPLFDMRQPESTVLSSFQMGTTIPLVAEMVGMGIPRETALFVSKVIEQDLTKTDVTNESIKQAIRRRMSQFSYWIQVQLKYLI